MASSVKDSFIVMVSFEDKLNECCRFCSRQRLD